MKKIVFLLAISFFFIACKKEGKNDQFSVNGKTYKKEKNTGGSIQTLVIKFVDNATFKEINTWALEGIDGYLSYTEYTGSYALSYPNVTFHFDSVKTLLPPAKAYDTIISRTFLDEEALLYQLKNGIDTLHFVN